MESKLKALKVVDLKAILATASVSLPAKANKQDLINTILASQPALDAYNTLHDVPVQVDHHKVPEKKAEPPAPVKAKPAEAPPKEEPVAEPTAAPEPPAVEPAPATVDPELEKRKLRAARFGIPLVESKPDRKNASRRKQSDDPERIKSRAARFGITAKPTTSPPSKRKAPATVTEEVDAEELARRQKRAERFGPKSTLTPDTVMINMLNCRVYAPPLDLCRYLCNDALAEFSKRRENSDSQSGACITSL
ncbi:hypothetical protein EDD85DRAFT_1022491 [Armillaria nabsnona]|nr:hypothetical protein EDD85DRAFT_1022491 [Armillaria nabsnona]